MPLQTCSKPHTGNRSELLGNRLEFLIVPDLGFIRYAAAVAAILAGAFIKRYGK